MLNDFLRGIYDVNLIKLKLSKFLRVILHVNLIKWILNKFLKDIKHVNLKKLILNENFKTQTQTNLIIYQKLKSKLASTVIRKLKSIIHQNQYIKLHPYLLKLKSNHQS